MPFIPAPTGTTRVVVNQTLKGVNIVNVLHYELRDGGTPETPTTASLNDFLDSFVADWVAGPLNHQNEDLVLVSVQAPAVEDENGGSVIRAVGQSGAGGAAADPIANVLAAVVSWRTPFSGRNARGRSYIAGISD